MGVSPGVRSAPVRSRLRQPARRIAASVGVLALIVVVLTVLFGVAWLLSRPGLNEFGDAVTAVFTAVAAVASLAAALQSRNAALESNKALRLHHRPEAELYLDADPREPGAAVSLSITFSQPHGEPAPVRNLELSWTTTDGRSDRLRLGVPLVDSHRLPSPVPLLGVKVLRATDLFVVAGLLAIEVSCVDTATSNRWQAHLTSTPPDGVGFVMQPQPIRFVPVD